MPAEQPGRDENLPLVSVVIDNYNYARFLREAIDSALSQHYPRLEVIVVDDGSTDGSREIISSYGERVRVVFKENGGQASAVNAGFAESMGDIVLLLDADDMLYPMAAARAAALFGDDQKIVNVRWAMDVIDKDGRQTGGVVPHHPLAEGDCKHALLDGGPSSCPAAPTSANAWSRSFLQRVLPAPTSGDYYRLGADEYLSNLAPLFGVLRTAGERLGCYRIHGNNGYTGKSFEERLQFELAGHEQQCEVVRRFARELGYDANVEQWRQRSWFRRLKRSVDELDAALPAGAPLILIDDNTWGAESFTSHRCVPFIEHDGKYWGPPPNDAAAILEIERLRRGTADFAAVAWPAFWWKDIYPRFFDYLRSTFRCALDNDRLVLFDLRCGAGTTPARSAPHG